VHPVSDGDDPGSGTDATLEAEESHAGATADVTLLNGSTLGAVKRFPYMLSSEMLASDIVEVTVKRFSNDWDHEMLSAKCWLMLAEPLDTCLMRRSYRKRVSDQDGCLQDPVLIDLRSARDFPGTIEDIDAAWNRETEYRFIVWMNRGHPRSGDARSFPGPAFTLDNCGMPDADFGHVCDGVQRTWWHRADRDSEISETRTESLIHETALPM
jgi:hypothetical protein